MKFEAILARDLSSYEYPQEYFDYQSRDKKTGKLGVKKMKPISFDFEYDSPVPEMYPSFDVTLKTENKELADKFINDRYSLSGYRWKMTLEEHNSL